MIDADLLAALRRVPPERIADAVQSLPDEAIAPLLAMLAPSPADAVAVVADLVATARDDDVVAVLRIATAEVDARAAEAVEALIESIEEEP